MNLGNYLEKKNPDKNIHSHSESVELNAVVIIPPLGKNQLPQGREFRSSY